MINKIIFIPASVPIITFISMIFLLQAFFASSSSLSSFWSSSFWTISTRKVTFRLQMFLYLFFSYFEVRQFFKQNTKFIFRIYPSNMNLGFITNLINNIFHNETYVTFLKSRVCSSKNLPRSSSTLSWNMKNTNFIQQNVYLVFECVFFHSQELTITDIVNNQSLSVLVCSE